MKFFIYSILMLISIFMLFLNHPLAMGLTILLQTLLLCLTLGMLMKTYWFSYILFLTFLGGLLVLFIYVSSIASNELFKPSMNLNILFLIILMMNMTFIFFMKNNMNWMNFYLNNEMMNFKEMMFFNNENKFSLSKLYNSQTFILMIMLIIYLFITLIVVVKITNIFYGSLRSSF
uniref:NADH-ubiquinone oxidoreductase chain 6 n=1 Tax=Emmelina monodactyla TaxID=467774 RepID=A0A076E8S9_9NEOP|nr:NADH dehydrogenase subunit 6 [Emmelina monodactyla]